MAKRIMMCATRECEWYGQARRLLGGCDCGAPLVPYRTPVQRLDEQMLALMEPMATLAVGAQRTSEAMQRYRDVWDSENERAAAAAEKVT